MKHLSIRKKYFYSVTLVCIISLTVISVISYIKSYRLVLNSKKAEVEMAAQRYSNEINSWLETQTNAVNSIKEDIQINASYYDKNHLKNMLEQKYKLAGGQVNDYYIGLPDKTLISGCGYIPKKGYDCTSRDWYQNAVKKYGLIYTLPYVDTYTGKMVITISEPLNIKGEFMGVLAADITLDYLMQLVEGIEITGNSYAFLIDSKKNIMTYPDSDFLPSASSSYRIDEILDGRFHALAKQMELGKPKMMMQKDYDNICKYFYASKINSTNWELVFVLPTTDVTSSLRTLLFGFAASYLISILISMIVIYFLLNGMLKPVMHLTAVVKQFGEKKMDVRCSISAQDEIGELGRSFNNMADMIQSYSTNLEQKVEERTRELTEQNARIQESIEYARMIQQTILPDEEIREVLKDYFVIWHPRDIVGGDFYWMRKFEEGFLILIGDCTGHGVPGALMTMAVNSMLDRIVDDMCHDDPAYILTELNDLLNKSLRSPDKTVQDGLDAGVICIFDNGTILYAGARISLFVFDGEESVEFKGIKHTIGVELKNKQFENHRIQFKQGMSFYLATDGMKDQVGGEKHLPFGKRGLLAVLNSIQQYSMEEQKKIIWSAYEDYKKSETLRDDVTLFGFRM